MINSHMMNVVLLSAPSGAGKTSIIEKIAQKHNIRYSISHTTRAPRAEEIAGLHYHFVSEKEFFDLQAAGAFLETTKIHGHYYGTAWKNFTPSSDPTEWLLMDLDFEGFLTLRHKLHDLVSVFILPPSLDILEKRILSRQPYIPAAELKIRLETACKEMEYVFEYDYSILNADINIAVEDLSMILKSEMLKNKRKKSFLESLIY